MTQSRVHLALHGQVQGVGFRFFTRQIAQELKLGGWVRNKTDGSVELVAEGEKRNIESLLDTLKNKHPWARVDALEADWQPYQGEFRAFEIT
ncbi:MAG: acylphosphatase [Elusimicrobia bacterium]|nr:acylphosphatase [Elusimicrobiota bacterium]